MSYVLDKETKIAFSLLIPLVGGIMWLSTLHAQTTANSVEIEKIQARQKEQDQKIEAILVNTTRANTKLDFILERKGHQWNR